MPSPGELRVGFLSYTDPAQADRMASMPFRMAAALEGKVGRLVTFSPEGGTGMSRVRPRPRNWPVVGRLVRYLSWRFLTFDGSIRRLEHFYPRITRRRTLRRARRVAGHLGHEAERFELDAIFGCIVTWPLYRFPLRLPYVFYTDATTTVVNESYPRFSDRCQGFKDACVEIEDEVYRGASAVAVPADRILESAIADHHLDASRGHVIPMGANLRPVVPLRDSREVDVPSREALRLCIVASDPVRKRTDFALEVTEILGSRGWAASLSIVGHATERAKASNAAKCTGLLRLTDESDVKRFRGVLAQSHFLVLPSLAEGAAIAPAEAAHFARPSVVSDVAGLPTVVKDGLTGRVLPLSASPGDYADAIESVAADAGMYRQFSAAALKRAHEVFTWDAWAERIAELLAQAVEAG